MTPPDPLEYLQKVHHRLGWDVGAGSAVGFVGFTYAIAPIRYFLAEAGVGLGLTGVALSVMPKLTVGSLQDRFILGVGYAAARAISPTTSEIDPEDASENETTWLHYLNFDAGYEHRWVQGFTFHFAVGAWLGLAGRTDNLVDLDGPRRMVSVHGKGFFQTRLGIGYWF